MKRVEIYSKNTLQTDLLVEEKFLEFRENYHLSKKLNYSEIFPKCSIAPS